MKAATAPRASRAIRILEVGADERIQTHDAPALSHLFRPGDVLVVNDAATLPASIMGTLGGAAIEARLVSRIFGARSESGGDDVAFTVALLGAGDHRQRTEDRPPPPVVRPGAVIVASGRLRLEVTAVSAISPRLVDVVLRADDGDPWSALYRAGRPVQYAYVPAPLALWDVQNVYASRPWAIEMPSAGRVVDGAALRDLRDHGVVVVAVTHAAGISSTGDAAIDACLPLPERWQVPSATAEAIAEARRRGGRVVAVGTSAARALEAAARTGASRARGRVVAGEGITDLLLGGTEPRLVVDAILTGVHESDTTHFALLGSFAPRARLDRALAIAEDAGLYGHEFGDAWLVWGEPRARANTAASASVGVSVGPASVQSAW